MCDSATYSALLAAGLLALLVVGCSAEAKKARTI